MRLVRPLAMTNANILRKIIRKLYSKNKLINIKINFKSINMNCGIKLTTEFLNFLNSFLKRANSATDLKLSGKAFHTLAAM